MKTQPKNTRLFQQQIYILSIKPNTYRYKTKFVFHKPYLPSLLTFRNKRKTQTDQIILNVFLICLKRTDLRAAATKIVFLHLLCYLYNLLRWIRFILCRNWKTLFLIKVYSLLVYFQPPCCCLFCDKCFKTNPYYMHYLLNNSTILIPKL